MIHQHVTLKKKTAPEKKTQGRKSRRDSVRDQLGEIRKAGGESKVPKELVEKVLKEGQKDLIDPRFFQGPKDISKREIAAQKYGYENIGFANAEFLGLLAHAPVNQPVTLNYKVMNIEKTFKLRLRDPKAAKNFDIEDAIAAVQGCEEKRETSYEAIWRLNEKEAKDWNLKYDFYRYKARKVITFNGPFVSAGEVKVALGLIAGFFTWDKYERCSLEELVRNLCSYEVASSLEPKVYSREVVKVVMALLLLSQTTMAVMITDEKGKTLRHLYHKKPLFYLSNRGNEKLDLHEVATIFSESTGLYAGIRRLNIEFRGGAIFDRNLDARERLAVGHGGVVKNVLSFPNPVTCRGLTMTEIRSHCILSAYVPYQSQRRDLADFKTRKFSAEGVSKLLGEYSSFKNRRWGYLGEFKKAANFYLDSYEISAGKNVCLVYNIMQKELSDIAKECKSLQLKPSSRTHICAKKRSRTHICANEDTHLRKKPDPRTHICANEDTHLRKKTAGQSDKPTIENTENKRENNLLENNSQRIAPVDNKAEETRRYPDIVRELGIKSVDEYLVSMHIPAILRPQIATRIKRAISDQTIKKSDIDALAQFILKKSSKEKSHKLTC
jgi:hypothetical protein